MEQPSLAGIRQGFLFYRMFWFGPVKEGGSSSTVIYVLVPTRGGRSVSVGFLGLAWGSDRSGSCPS